MRLGYESLRVSFNSKRLYLVPGKIDNVKCEYLIEVVRPVEYVEEGKEEGK